jgi:hypothetical protein
VEKWKSERVKLFCALTAIEHELDAEWSFLADAKAPESVAPDSVAFKPSSL